VGTWQSKFQSCASNSLIYFRCSHLNINVIIDAPLPRPSM
jgi:hypothetical protein